MYYLHPIKWSTQGPFTFLGHLRAKTCTPRPNWLTPGHLGGTPVKILKDRRRWYLDFKTPVKYLSWVGWGGIESTYPVRGLKLLEIYIKSNFTPILSDILTNLKEVQVVPIWEAGGCIGRIAREGSFLFCGLPSGRKAYY